MLELKTYDESEFEYSVADDGNLVMLRLGTQLGDRRSLSGVLDLV